MEEVPDVSIKETVLNYERFLEDKLKTDLVTVLDQRDKIYDKVSLYYKLRNDITVMKDAELKELTTKVDLGCNVYVTAKIPDTTTIFVNVGYGFHAQLTLDEALVFIEKKTTQLTSETEHLTTRANQIRAHIKSVLTALQELQLTVDSRT